MPLHHGKGHKRTRYRTVKGKLLSYLHQENSIPSPSNISTDNIYHAKIHNGFSHEELQDRLSEVGFKSIEIRTFYYGNRIFMNRAASMFICHNITDPKSTR